MVIGRYIQYEKLLYGRLVTMFLSSKRQNRQDWMQAVRFSIVIACSLMAAYYFMGYILVPSPEVLPFLAQEVWEDIRDIIRGIDPLAQREGIA